MVIKNIKNIKNNSNRISNSNTTGKQNFVSLPNIFYILLISSCVSGILLNMFGIKSITNIFELFIIVLIITILVLYQLLKKKKMTLDKLEYRSILYFIGFLILIWLFGLFIKFTSNKKDSIEGKLLALILILLIFIFVNLIFFIIGMGSI